MSPSSPNKEGNNNPFFQDIPLRTFPPGTSREHSLLSPSEYNFAFNDTSSIRSSEYHTELSEIEARRRSKLRGVDSKYASELSRTNSPINLEIPSFGDSLKKGLEDALGKDGNWLSKINTIDENSPSDTEKDDSNSDHRRSASTINIDLESTAAEDSRRSGSYLSINNESTSLPTSRTERFSNAVKSLSNRLTRNSKFKPISRETEPTATPYENPFETTSETFHYSPTASTLDSTLSNRPYPSTFTRKNVPIVLPGKSFMYFDNESKLRRFLYNMLHQSWVEQFALFLIFFQTAVLTASSITNIYKHIPDSNTSFSFPPWYTIYTNWCHLFIFLCYTFLIISKSIAYGFWNDSQRFEFFTKAESEIKKYRGPKKNITVVKSFANIISTRNRRNLAVEVEQNPANVAPERAYLRGSWARVDFIATIGFWISFFMMISNADVNGEIFIFRLLSGLPILHLLNLTKGTTSIMKSLKKAAPLLANVFIFIAFFW